MKRDHIWLIVILVVLPGAWFVTVDEVEFYDECPECHFSRYVDQYRVLGLPVSEQSIQQRTVAQLVCEDFGRPCTHPRLTRNLMCRVWGLIYPNPIHNGLTAHIDTSWYDADVRNRVQQIGRDDPDVAQRYYDRVIVGQDWDYAHLFTHQLMLPGTTPWNLTALSDPPAFEWVDDQSPVRSLLYVGEPYGGKPTKVFAYYATPGTLAGDTSEDRHLPAVVLIHGGGGTAFAEWCELWAKRGYAAIAMDLAGHRPNEGQNPHQGKNRTRLPDGGPDQGDDEKFGSIDKAPGEQWPYHAVANVVLAHSLIRSFKEVDAERTAVTGISWGGYLACIVAGVDNRFAAAVPVYGCGFLHDNSVWLKRFAQFTPEQKQRWVALWDPSQYLPHVSMPILFINGTNDFAYPLDSYMKSYDAVPKHTDKSLRIAVDMKHGHPAGWAPKEIGLFIDSVLWHAPTPIGNKADRPLGLPQVGEVERLGDGRIRIAVTHPLELAKAELHQTTDDGPINKRAWTSLPLTARHYVGETRHIVFDAPPDDATAWFVSITDERGAMVTTRVTIAK